MVTRPSLRHCSAPLSTPEHRWRGNSGETARGRVDAARPRHSTAHHRADLEATRRTQPLARRADNGAHHGPASPPTAELGALIAQVLDPPFATIGALPVDALLSPKARGQLAADLNTRLATDAEAQLLEDCACLVFLAHYLESFAAKETENEVVTILQKTWRKMGDVGRAHAVELTLGDGASRLLARALAPSESTSR